MPPALRARIPRGRYSIRLTRTMLVKLFFVYGLCMDSDVFVRLFGGVSTVSGQSSLLHSGNSNPVLFALTVVFMVSALAFVLPIYRTATTSLLLVPWFTAIYVESLGSTLWSSEPNNTFRYGVTLWVYMFCGLVASLYLSTDEIVRLVGNTVSVLALLSFPAQRIFPQDTIVPGWTGIYGEKNHLGIGMTIGLIALVVPRTRWTLLRGLQAATMCLLLVLAQSGTAFVCTAAAALVLVLLRSEVRLRRLIMVAVGGLGTLAFFTVPHLLDRILAVGGKNTTLTGRDVIWRFSIQQWARRPLLGWGYAAFWGAEEALVYQVLHWMPGHSHNGFLEVGLALGIVGVVIIIGILISATRFGFFVRRNVNEVAGTWLLCSLAILFLHDMTEVDFLLPAPLWFIFTVAYFTALRDAQQVRARRLAGTQASRQSALAVPQALTPAPLGAV